ncbi:MAG: hypothetical protein M3Z23_18440 [Acidobacteriota bacterium]|nr:hypothetical protein [Acidobacteriota bacterium]
MNKTAWPEGKQFAFTVFDDPDGQTESHSRLIYKFLADVGFRTTKGVWPLAPRRAPNSLGDTCEGNPSYLSHCVELQRAGFEMVYHCASPQDSTRGEVIESLDRFKDYFGHDPATMANHYNQDAIYWGPARVTGAQRLIYQALTRGSTRNRFFGHVEGHPSFWGDICRERIRYCRNLVFAGINTLSCCPQMPYYDAERPYVQAWYCSVEGNQLPAFLKAISESNQDRLLEESGSAILYTHFGLGFVENGRLNSRFVQLMTRLSHLNGWFVPVGILLDYLTAKKGGLTVITPSERAALERRWLLEKVFRGTS